jgi:hypothetical protein
MILPTKLPRNPDKGAEKAADQLQVLIADTAWRSQNASDIVGAIKSPGENT